MARNLHQPIKLGGPTKNDKGNIYLCTIKYSYRAFFISLKKRGEIEMKKNSNMEYVMKNLGHNGNVVDWLYSIKSFFGNEQVENFCEYFIHSHQILRTNDIRNLIQHHSMSVYKMKDTEQLAFISIYKPINKNSKLIQNMSFEKAQKFYRRKSIELSKRIKQLGYSYSTTLGNWKDKETKDTYQREYVFVIYSEQENSDQFRNNIFNLLKDYKIDTALITDVIVNDEPQLQIKSKLFDTGTGIVLQEYADTTVEVVEDYLSSISDTKVLFKIPYEKNKNILWEKHRNIADYYSKIKQEEIRKVMPSSFNMGMLKQSLIHSFEKENYNS